MLADEVFGVGVEVLRIFELVSAGELTTRDLFLLLPGFFGTSEDLAKDQKFACWLV